MVSEAGSLLEVVDDDEGEGCEQLATNIKMVNRAIIHVMLLIFKNTLSFKMILIYISAEWFNLQSIVLIFNFYLFF